MMQLHRQEEEEEKVAPPHQRGPTLPLDPVQVGFLSSVPDLDLLFRASWVRGQPVLVLVRGPGGSVTYILKWAGSSRVPQRTPEPRLLETFNGFHMQDRDLDLAPGPG